MMSPASSFVMFVVGCLVALGFQIYFFSPMNPELSHWPSPSPPSNKLLQEVTKLGEGSIQGPEDVYVDKHGFVYTTSRDGWIKRLHRDGFLEDWKMVNSSAMLGIIVNKDGDVVVCDADNGLIKVNEDGVTILASHFNGSKINFADELVEAADGVIYFTNPSDKYGLHNWMLDVLEAKPHGQLFKYDPSTKETSLVLDNLCFPNGVALSESQDYLLFCESWKFRCLKYWLKGDKIGRTEIFVDNLPGCPDNIHIAPDGSFWIALIQVTSQRMRFVQTSKIAKRILATYPSLISYMLRVDEKATVVNVDTDGRILRRLDDPDGKLMTFVTTALEYEDHLYFGSLANNFIGRLPLKKINLGRQDA